MPPVVAQPIETMRSKRTITMKSILFMVVWIGLDTCHCSNESVVQKQTKHNIVTSRDSRKLILRSSKEDVVAIEYGDESVISMNESHFSCNRDNDTFVRYRTKFSWVVDFYAPWCPHCQKFAPVFGEEAGTFSVTSPDVKFGALDCVSFKTTCRKFGIKTYPTVVLFRKIGSSICTTDMKRSIVWHGNRTRGELSSWVAEKLDRRPPPGLSKQIRVVDRRIKSFKSHVPEIPVEQQNLAAAVFFTFRNNIFYGNDTLAADDAKALRDWIELLERQMDDRDTIASLGRLRRSFFDSENLDLDRWNEVLSETRIFGRAPSDSAWTPTCAGFGHGYACVLWGLLHYLTMHTADSNALQTLLSIRSFVLRFFRCEDCQKHFELASECLLASSAADAVDGTRTVRGGHACDRSPFDRRSAVLWLWELHNDVTVRVFSGQHPRLYPSRTSCEACRATKDGTTWNEDRVYDFLQTMYSVSIPEAMDISSLPATRRRRDFLLEEEREEDRWLRKEWDIRSWMFTIITILVVGLAVTSIMMAIVRFSESADLRSFSKPSFLAKRKTQARSLQSFGMTTRRGGVLWSDVRSPLIKRVTSTV